MLIRVTNRMQKFLGRRCNLAQPHVYSDLDPSHEWYCNVMVAMRTRALLATHATTLFSFVVPSLRARWLDTFSQGFREHLSWALERDGLAACSYLASGDSDHFAPTASRSVLGSMNDFTRMYKWHLEDAGSVEGLDLGRVHDAMNHAPMSYLDWRRPVDEMRDLVVGRAGGSDTHRRQGPPN